MQLDVTTESDSKIRLPLKRPGYYVLRRDFYISRHAGTSSFFDQQVMHCAIRKHYESGAVHTQSDRVNAEIIVVESEAGENCSTRNFNVEAVFVVDEAERRNFVDNEAFEAVVEDT